VKSSLLAWRHVAFSTLAVVGLSVCFTARAENHALIMWVGEYADPRASLPGIDLDANNARKIARGMGIPEKNITEVKNEQLTWDGMKSALADLVARIAQDDKVFIYYSGHGAQQVNTGGSKKCSEGLVAQDVRLYYDRDLEADLATLGAKASQVVMMNDSCFSGGASIKALPQPGRMLVPKAYPGVVRTGSSAEDEGYKCGDAVNKSFMTKSLQVVKRKGAQLLYVAAAGDNEVSFASTEGSIATHAWAECITDPATDQDLSGTISGEELRACAQASINASPQRERQTITLTGNPGLPVSFATSDAKPIATHVNGASALEDIRAGSDASYSVKLTSTKDKLRIGQDYFDFTVETNREGYLYVLQVGTDGETFNLLFPNKVDNNNRVAAGKHRFPRESWRLRSAGPSGTNHLMALVSSVPKDFGEDMDTEGTFATAPATQHATKSLVVVATGASEGGNGRYGASAVTQVHEVP